MTSDSKAQKASRNSKLVERYGSTAGMINAVVFDADFWENLCLYAGKPAYIGRVRECLDKIEDDGLMVFPSVFYKSKKVREIIQKTEQLMVDRAFKRHR